MKKSYYFLVIIVFFGVLLETMRCTKNSTSYSYKDLTIFHLGFSTSDILFGATQYNAGDTVYATATVASNEIAMNVKTIEANLYSDSGDHEYLILRDDFPGLASEPEIKSYAGWIPSVGQMSHKVYNRILEVNPNGDMIVISLRSGNGKVLSDTSMIVQH